MDKKINDLAKAMLAVYGDQMAAQQATWGAVEICERNVRDCAEHGNPSGSAYWLEAQETAMLVYNAIGRQMHKRAKSPYARLAA